MKRARKRHWIVSLVLLGLMGPAAYLSWLATTQPYFSSPTEARAESVVGEVGMALDGVTLLDFSLQPHDVIGPDPEFDIPIQHLVDASDGYVGVKTIRKTPPPTKTIPGVALGEVIAGETGSAELGQDDQMIKVLGFAVVVPEQADAIDLDQGRPRELEFLHPVTMEVMPTPKLAAFGAPDEFLSAPRAGLRQPGLRVLVWSRNLPAFGIAELTLIDARTNFQVAYPEQIQVVGAFAALDFPMRIWHDTPLRLGMDVRCGAFGAFEITPDEPQQLLVMDAVRFQVAKVVNGEIGPWSERRNRVTAPIGQTPGVSVVGRASSSEYLEQFGIRFRSEPNAPPGWFVAPEEFMSPSAAHLPVGSREDLELIFYSGRKRVWFEIAGLPQMPNGRELKNLFDVRIPRVLIPEQRPMLRPYGSAPTLPPFYHAPRKDPRAELFRLVTDAAELGEWLVGLEPTEASKLPETRYDASLRDLLDLALSNQPDRAAEIVEGPALQLTDHVTWKTRLREWWEDTRPEWSPW